MNRLEIENSGIEIIVRDDILSVSLNLTKFYSLHNKKNNVDVGDIAQPLNSYIIFKTLQDRGKNYHNGQKIIEKKDVGNCIEYHFNYEIM